MRTVGELPHIPWLGRLSPPELSDAHCAGLVGALAAHQPPTRGAQQPSRAAAILGLALLAISTVVLHESAPGGFLRALAVSEGVAKTSSSSGVSEMKRTIALGTGIIGLGVVTAASSAQSSAPLLHWYSFDASVTDAVGGVNGALFGNASIVDGALWTDGASGFVEFPQKIVPTSGSFTVALWFKTESIAAPNSIIELLSQGCSGCPGFYIGRDHTGGVWRNFHDYHTPVGLAALFPQPGAWHHVAVSVNRAVGASTLWVDGVSVATLPAAPMTEAGSPTRLARQFGVYGEYHHGSIDDVRIYGGALSGAHIAALAANFPPAPGDCDANGMQDALQIATARAFDSDNDGLLDSCEAGVSMPVLKDIVITQGTGSPVLRWPVCGAWDTRTQVGEHLWDLWVSRTGTGGPWLNKADEPAGNPFTLDATLREGMNTLHCRMDPNNCTNPFFTANLWFDAGAQPTVSGTNGSPIAPYSGVIPGLVPGAGVPAAGALAARVGAWDVRITNLSIGAAADQVGPVSFAPSGAPDITAAISISVIRACGGDVSRNGFVDGVDLAAVLGAWATDGHGQFECDIDGDGIVGGSDLAQVLGSWGPCP